MENPRSKFVCAALTAVLMLTAAQRSLNAQDFFQGLGGIGGNLEGLGAQQDPDGRVDINAQFVAPTGDRPAVVMITLDIAPGWHVYSNTQPDGGPLKTTLTLTSSPDYEQLGRFKSTPEPHSYVDQEVFVGTTIEEHEGKVTWYAPVELAEGVDPQNLVINGQIAFQKCHEQHGCVNEDVAFAASLGKGVPIGPLDFNKPVAPAPTATVESPVAESAGEAYNLDAIQFTELEAAEKSVVYYLFWAFIGGMVLNLMPCVLPVIGLKVMSFVQQAGYSRTKALALNLWYALGIMVVFWALAALAAFAGLSWGEQFGSTTFNIVMASIVFVMALSLLGVWEIHVPDAVNRSASHSVVQQEGASGAFFKGVMTTLLATPCTGPGMALALGWAVRQSSLTIFAVFTALGLGMATPYLLIGAFPSLVNFLPRPGNWMVTFKQLMGFVLMGTVIFLLAQLESHYLLPTLCLLVSLGLGCWIYSLLPIGAPFSERSQTYALCGAIVAAGAVFGFAWLAPVLQGSEEDWQDFSLARLQQVAVEEGKTVLVDFGADWCTNCIVLENTVLHTKPVEDSIKKNGVVPMFADFSRQPPELKQTLSALKSNGVPVIAIFPGGAPHQPIVFRGVYTQSQLLDAIDKATNVRRQAPVAIHSGVGSSR